jgi:pyruvate formate lyase activating enzyme
MLRKMKEAMLWHKEKDRIRCDLCGRRCLIPGNSLGFCLVRKNIKGRLFSLNYGKIISINVDPIEKKPLFHFLPGSHALSIASPSCNFCCKYCCNFEISQVFRDSKTDEVVGADYTPKQIVDIAVENNCESISYTYTEPTVFFEFAYDTAKLAHEKNLKNTFVTNGYMTPDAVKKIAPYLDAATVDFKGSADPKCYSEFSLVPDVKPIFEALKEMKKQKIFVEITDLIIPKIGDDLKHFKKLAMWVYEEMGADTPFHILRFFPNYKVLDLEETPIALLEKCVEIAKNVGLQYVYLGNVLDSKWENTYCPSCGATVVERRGFFSVPHLKENKCPKCGEKLNFVLR